MLLKICGMARQEDMDCAAEAGFDFCGFIFAAKSPRRLAPERAAELQSGSMKRVGVFVEQEAEEIMRIMRAARLDFAQLHGAQDGRAAERIGAERVIRVLWPERYESKEAMRLAAAQMRCAYFLLDSGMGGGGSGRACDWRKLRGLSLPAPWLLAGGLGSHSALEALSLCRPDGLDFNSNLEDAPGVKNHAKLRAAALAARGGGLP